MKQQKVILIGGPLSGWGQGADDGYYGTSADVVYMLSGDEEYAYKRGRMVGEVEQWHYDEALTLAKQGKDADLILPGQVGKTEGAEAASIVKVHYNDLARRWEMWHGDELVQVREKDFSSDPVERRFEAAEWMREAFPDAIGKLVEAK